MSDRTIDDINRDLSEVLDGLLGLPSDAFAERYVLQERQRALRREAAPSPKTTMPRRRGW